MKSEHIYIALAALLVLVLGIQTYATFRLNDRFNQLFGPVSTAENQIQLPKLSNPILPRPGIEDDFLKDRSWIPYLVNSIAYSHCLDLLTRQK